MVITHTSERRSVTDTGAIWGSLHHCSPGMRGIINRGLQWEGGGEYGWHYSIDTRIFMIYKENINIISLYL